MDAVCDGKTVRYLKYALIISWSLLAGIFEWLLPRSWYAKDVDQDIVLITGAGSGLGRAIALEYAQLNSSLILWDINESGLEETKSLVESQYKRTKLDAKTRHERKFCYTYIVDVSDRRKIQEFADKVHQDLNDGRAIDEPERYVSVLVNNAGIYYGLMLQDLRDDQIERIFNINILAHFWTVRAFLPNMIEHERGHIVEIASMGGISGMLKQVDYCATKFATVGFEESLSIELDYMGLGGKIHTTSVCPLFFSSNLFTGFNSDVASLMSSDYVAKEAVMTMRCNHSRILLPKLSAYLLFFFRTFMTRKSLIQCTKALGFDQGIKEIKGRAAGAF